MNKITIEEVQRLAREQGIALDPSLLVDYAIGTWFWAVHHQVISEPLTEPLVNRLYYILTQKPEHERAIRMAAIRPMKGLPYADRQKAYADRQKAYADWQKAYADWQKAYADWQKADADRQKADADRQKTYADRQKTYADWQKADADWWKIEYPDHPEWDLAYGLVF